MKFCTSYKYAGKTWGLVIDAENWRDAEARCKRLNLNLDGELIVEIPAAMPFAGLFIGLLCRFINAVSNFKKDRAVRQLIKG